MFTHLHCLSKVAKDLLLAAVARVKVLGVKNCAEAA
jgi:hypothetical protein